MIDYNSSMIRMESQSPVQTTTLGGLIGKNARPGDVIALIGELGAGKTQFVRGMAAARGVTAGKVASPTFVIVHEYTGDSGDIALIHIDAYRIDSLEELESIGWDRGFSELRTVAPIVIEWADRIETELEGDALFIRLAHVNDSTRDIQIDYSDGWRNRIESIRSMVESQEIKT